MSPIGDYVPWRPTESFDARFASPSRHFPLNYQLPPEKCNDLTRLSHAPDASNGYVTNNESSDWPIQNLINQSNTLHGMPHQLQNMENNFGSNVLAYPCHQAMPSGEPLKPLNTCFSLVSNPLPTSSTNLNSPLSEGPYSYFLPQNPNCFPASIDAKGSKTILPFNGLNTNWQLSYNEHATEQFTGSFGSKTCGLISYQSELHGKPTSTETFGSAKNSKGKARAGLMGGTGCKSITANGKKVASNQA